MSDSRFRAGGPAPDPLGDRLGALRADTDRVATPLARSIRRRGDRRTAIQIAGTTLGAVSAISLGAFVLPLGGGADDNVPVESATTTPAVVPTLTEDVLLSPGALDEVLGSVDAAELRWAVGQTHTDPGLALSSICLPRVTSPESSQALAREFVVSQYEGTEGENPGVPSGVAEIVIVQPDVARAEETATMLRHWLHSCGEVDDGTTVNAAWTLAGAGDGGFAVEVLVDAVEGSELGLAHQVAVGSAGSVLVGVLVTKSALEGGTPGDTLAVLQAAMARVCQTTGTGCPSDAITAEGAALDSPDGGSTIESVEPLDGRLIRMSDLPTWNGLVPWDMEFDIPSDAVASGPYGTVCNLLWRDLGATSENQRTFTVAGSDPGDGPAASEVVAQFADEETAAAAMDEMRVALNSCQGSSQVDPALTVEEIWSAADDGTAWLISLPPSGAKTQRIFISVVHSGSATAMITVDFASADALPSEPFVDLVTRASERLF